MPPSQRTRAQGFIEIHGPDGRTEIETFTCCHCNAIVNKPLPGEDSGFCNRCMAMECLPCARTGKCVPFEKKLLAMEARGRLLASMG